MAMRGRIVVECDIPECHAELILVADDLFALAILEAAQDDEWAYDDRGEGRWICDLCRQSEGSAV